MNENEERNKRIASDPGLSLLQVAIDNNFPDQHISSVFNNTWIGLEDEGFTEGLWQRAKEQDPAQWGSVSREDFPDRAREALAKHHEPPEGHEPAGGLSRFIKQVGYVVGAADAEKYKPVPGNQPYQLFDGTEIYALPADPHRALLATANAFIPALRGMDTHSIDQILRAAVYGNNPGTKQEVLDLFKEWVPFYKGMKDQDLMEELEAKLSYSSTAADKNGLIGRFNNVSKAVGPDGKIKTPGQIYSEDIVRRLRGERLDRERLEKRQEAFKDKIAKTMGTAPEGAPERIAAALTSLDEAGKKYKVPVKPGQVFIRKKPISAGLMRTPELADAIDPWEHQARRDAVEQIKTVYGQLGEMAGAEYLPPDVLKNMKERGATGSDDDFNSGFMNAAAVGLSMAADTAVNAPYIAADVEAWAYNNLAYAVNHYTGAELMPLLGYYGPADTILSKNIKQASANVAQYNQENFDNRHIWQLIADKEWVKAGDKALMALAQEAPRQFVNISAGKIVGPVYMGFSAFLGQYRDLLNQGYTPDEAIRTGIPHAIIEMGFERWGTFGVIDKVQKRLAGIVGAEKASKAVMRGLATFFLGGTREGWEEFATTLAQDYNEYLNGVNPNYNFWTSVSQAVDDGIVGFLMSGQTTVQSGIGKIKQTFVDADSKVYREGLRQGTANMPKIVEGLPTDTNGNFTGFKSWKEMRDWQDKAQVVIPGLEMPVENETTIPGDKQLSKANEQIKRAIEGDLNNKVPALLRWLEIYRDLPRDKNGVQKRFDSPKAAEDFAKKHGLPYQKPVEHKGKRKKHFDEGYLTASIVANIQAHVAAEGRKVRDLMPRNQGSGKVDSLATNSETQVLIKRLNKDLLEDVIARVAALDAIAEATDAQGRPKPETGDDPELKRQRAGAISEQIRAGIINLAWLKKQSEGKQTPETEKVIQELEQDIRRLVGADLEKLTNTDLRSTSAIQPTLANQPPAPIRPPIGPKPPTRGPERLATGKPRSGQQNKMIHAIAGKVGLDKAGLDALAKKVAGVNSYGEIKYSAQASAVINELKKMEMVTAPGGSPVDSAAAAELILSDEQAEMLIEPEAEPELQPEPEPIVEEAPAKPEKKPVPVAKAKPKPKPKQKPKVPVKKPAEPKVEPEPAPAPEKTKVGFISEPAKAKKKPVPAKKKTKKVPVKTKAKPAAINLPEIEVKTGTATQVRRVDGSDPGHYVAAKITDIITSHNPDSFTKNPQFPANTQEREYDFDKAEQMKVIQHARNFVAAYLLTDNPDLTNGPPVIDERGIVLGGNSRAMTLMRVFKESPELAAEYTAQLRENAERFGLKPEDIGDDTILLRQLDSRGLDQEALRKLVSEYNRVPTQAISPISDAISRAARLQDKSVVNIANLIEEKEGRNTLRALMSDPTASRRIIEVMTADNVWSKTEQAKFVTPEGLLTEEGKSLIENVMVASLIDDAELLRNSPPSATARIVRAAPDIIRTRAYGPEWDISERIKDGLRVLQAWDRDKFKTLAELNATDDLFEPKSGVLADQDAILMADWLFNARPTDFAKAVQAYANDAAYADGVTSQGLLDFARTPGTAFDVFEAAFGSRRSAINFLAKLIQGSMADDEVPSMIDAIIDNVEGITTTEIPAEAQQYHAQAQRLIDEYGLTAGIEYVDGLCYLDPNTEAGEKFLRDSGYEQGEIDYAKENNLKARIDAAHILDTDDAGFQRSRIVIFKSGIKADSYSHEIVHALEAQGLINGLDIGSERLARMVAPTIERYMNGTDSLGALAVSLPVSEPWMEGVPLINFDAEMVRELQPAGVRAPTREDVASVQGLTAEYLASHGPQKIAYTDDLFIPPANGVYTDEHKEALHDALIRETVANKLWKMDNKTGKITESKVLKQLLSHYNVDHISELTQFYPALAQRFLNGLRNIQTRNNLLIRRKQVQEDAAELGGDLYKTLKFKWDRQIDKSFERLGKDLEKAEKDPTGRSDPGTKVGNAFTTFFNDMQVFADRVEQGSGLPFGAVVRNIIHDGTTAARMFHLDATSQQETFEEYGGKGDFKMVSVHDQAAAAAYIHKMETRKGSRRYEAKAWNDLTTQQQAWAKAVEKSFEWIKPLVQRNAFIDWLNGTPGLNFKQDAIAKMGKAWLRDLERTVLIDPDRAFAMLAKTDVALISGNYFPIETEHNPEIRPSFHGIMHPHAGIRSRKKSKKGYITLMKTPLETFLIHQRNVLYRYYLRDNFRDLDNLFKSATWVDEAGATKSIFGDKKSYVGKAFSNFVTRVSQRTIDSDPGDVMKMKNVVGWMFTARLNLPDKLIRNMLQNLAYDQRARDFINTFKSLSPEDKEYFVRYVSQEEGLIKDQFFVPDAASKLRQMINRPYAMSDTWNRLRSWKAHLPTEKSAWNEFDKGPKNTTTRNALYNRSLLYTLRPNDQMRAWETYASEGAESAARFVTERVVSANHFLYVRYLRSPTEQSEKGEWSLNLFTYPKGRLKRFMMPFIALKSAQTSKRKLNALFEGGFQIARIALATYALNALRGWSFGNDDEEEPYGFANIFSELPELPFAFSLPTRVTEEQLKNTLSAVKYTIEGNFTNAARSLDSAGAALIPFYEIACRMVEVSTGRRMDGPAGWVAESIGLREELRDRKRTKYSTGQGIGHILFNSRPGPTRRRDIRKQGTIPVPLQALRGSVPVKFLRRERK